MRPQIPFFLLLLALAVRPESVLACSCLDSGPFSKVAPGADLVVVGEVVSHHENSMQVEVVQVLKGEETRKRLTFWGDNGMQCRPYVSQFPEKTRWVFAVSLHKGAQGDLSNLEKPLPEWAAKPPFYVISVCGSYWLEVRGEDAYGRINRERDQGEEAIPVHELQRWFEAGARGKLSPLGP